MLSGVHNSVATAAAATTRSADQMPKKFRFDPNDEFYKAPPMCSLLHYRDGAILAGVAEVFLLLAGVFAFASKSDDCGGGGGRGGGDVVGDKKQRTRRFAFGSRPDRTLDAANYDRISCARRDNNDHNVRRHLHGVAASSHSANHISSRRNLRPTFRLNRLDIRNVAWHRLDA